MVPTAENYIENFFEILIQMKLIFSFIFLADCRLWYHTENFENCREICSLNRNCRLWNWKTATIHELNCQLFTYSQHLGPMIRVQI